MMVLSNLTATKNAVAPSAVLVVMQGRQLGINGPVFWRLTVVRLVPQQQQATSGGVPRKT